MLSPDRHPKSIAKHHQQNLSTWQIQDQIIAILQGQESFSWYQKLVEKIKWVSESVESCRRAFNPSMQSYEAVLEFSHERFQESKKVFFQEYQKLMEHFHKSTQNLPPQLQTLFEERLFGDLRIEYAASFAPYHKEYVVWNDTSIYTLLKHYSTHHTFENYPFKDGNPANIERLSCRSIFFWNSPKELSIIFWEIKALRYLGLKNCNYENFPEEFISVFAQLLEGVKVLELGENDLPFLLKKEHDGVFHKAFEKLLHLSFWDSMHQIPNEELSAVFPHLHHLKSVSFAWIPLYSFSCESLALFAKYLSKVRNINLEWTGFNKMTPDQLKAFAPIFLNARSLQFSGNQREKIPSTIWELVLTSAPHIQEILNGYDNLLETLPITK